MINAKLKALSAVNFAPFADPINFTTQIDKNKKEYMNNTFAEGETLLNKVSFIYGANGAGKTFFCKILSEIQRLLFLSPFTLGNNSQIKQLPMFKGIDAKIQKFIFDVSYEEQPTTFSIEVIVDSIAYHYEFSIQGNRIVYELLTKKFKRKEILIERRSPEHKDIALRSEFKSFEIHKQAVKEEALCLGIAHTLNNPLAVKIVNAINSIVALNMTTPHMATPDIKTSFTEERILKYTKVLTKANPMLRALDIAVSEEDVKHLPEFSDFENREVIMTKMTLSVNPKYAKYRDGVEEKTQSLNFFKDESLGTVKLFTALPYLYDTLEYGGVLVLDEIENGLHLSLVRDIIRLFTDSDSNPHNAQLICTTHQPLLIDADTRRDQVWVINKDTHGKSGIIRLSEFSTSRSKINLTNLLLKKAFGCNPEPFFRN